MRHLMRVLARLRGLFAGQDADADLRAEFEAHLEMETAEYIRRGMAPAEARRKALLASGGLEQAAESVRDQRGIPAMAALGADVRFSLRELRVNAGFTALVVLTLALGIGANTAIYGVLRGVLLRPLPHAEGDRLVYLRQSTDAGREANLAFSVP